MPDNGGKAGKQPPASFASSTPLKPGRDVSEQLRPPLGQVLSRKWQSQEWLPAPPKGYEMVKFRTSFSHHPDATETPTLTFEEGEWRVSGYVIE